MSEFLLREKIADLVTQAALSAREKGEIDFGQLPSVEITHPVREDYGDYTTNLAMKLAGPAKLAPLRIAQILVDHLAPAQFLADSKVAPPGFVNFIINPDWLARQVELINAQGERFGQVLVEKPLKIQLEYVSANPTGPLHTGHGRGAVVGDVLANVLAARGHQVEREFYINDTGSQIDNFADSLFARYCQELGKEAPFPANGYHGHYLIEVAREIVADYGDMYLTLSPDQVRVVFRELGLTNILAGIRADLEFMRVNFDVWFSEASLFDDGEFEETFSILKNGGFTLEKEGAVWFASSTLGEDKDDVLIRGTGEPTYFAKDIAYHRNKFERRGFDRVINVWGADHHGDVPRMKAAMGAIGVDPDRLVVLLTQMISMKRGGEIVRMSKRTGEFITLRELLEEVGVDAVRFFFLARSADSQMDFDLELAKSESKENPVYYVQYAHARIASILQFSKDKVGDFEDGNVALLTTEPELALIRKLLLLPELIDEVARSLEPHALPHYAQDLAASFHSFYKQCRVVSKDVPLSKARLKLVLAAKIVLANTLHLMGITAPEKM